MVQVFARGSRCSLVNSPRSPHVLAQARRVYHYLVMLRHLLQELVHSGPFRHVNVMHNAVDLNGYDEVRAGDRAEAAVDQRLVEVEDEAGLVVCEGGEEGEAAGAERAAGDVAAERVGGCGGLVGGEAGVGREGGVGVEVRRGCTSEASECVRMGKWGLQHERSTGCA